MAQMPGTFCCAYIALPFVPLPLGRPGCGGATGCHEVAPRRRGTVVEDIVMSCDVNVPHCRRAGAQGWCLRKGSKSPRGLCLRTERVAAIPGAGGGLPAALQLSRNIGVVRDATRGLDGVQLVDNSVCNPQRPGAVTQRR